VANVRLDRVISAAEYSQFAAGYLASLVSLPEPTLALSVMVRDKQAMKTRVREAGIPCARQQSLTRENALESLTSALESLGRPVVVKPRAGQGTVDTWTVHDPAVGLELMKSAPAGTEMLAEEYISGAEYYVDAVWLDGEPRVFGIGRYIVPLIEVTNPGHRNGGVLLRPDDHQAEYAELEQLSRRVNDALGIRTAITHAEYFRTNDGLWIFSEIATRPGGGGTAAVFAHLGADLRQVWARTIVHPEEPVPRLSSPSTAYLGSVHLAPAVTGTVAQGPDENQLRAIPWVVDVSPGPRAGDRVTQTHSAAWSWIVYLEADSFEEFQERSEAVESIGGSSQ